MAKKLFPWLVSAAFVGTILLWFYWPKIIAKYYDSVLTAKIVVLPHAEWALQRIDYEGEYRETDTIIELEDYGRVPGTVYAFEPKPVTFTFVSPCYDTIDTTIALIGDSILSLYGYGRDFYKRYVYRNGDFINETGKDIIRIPHIVLCFERYGTISWAASVFEETHYVTEYKTYTPHGDSLQERKMIIDGYPPILKAEETRVVPLSYLDTLTNLFFQSMASVDLATQEVETSKDLVEFDSTRITKITYQPYSFPPSYYFKCGNTIYEIR